MKPVNNLIRVELRNAGKPYGENASFLKYIWKCCDCGEEYFTHTVSNPSGYCSKCKEKHRKQAEENRLIMNKKNQIRALRSLWKDITDLSEDEMIDINGKTYFSKKALNDRFNDLLASQ